MDYSVVLQEIKDDVRMLDSINIKPQPVNMTLAQLSAVVKSIKKQEILQNQSSQYFLNIFDNNDYYKNISTYLDQILRNITAKSSQNGVSLRANTKFQRVSQNIKMTIDILAIEYGNLAKEDSKRFFKRNKSKMKSIKNTLSELLPVQEKINKVLKDQSNIIVNVVLEEFKVLYKFFLYSIKIARARKDEILLMEIASTCDNIVSMINPIFSKESLKTDELIYHYLVYELRELKSDCMLGY